MKLHIVMHSGECGHFANTREAHCHHNQVINVTSATKPPETSPTRIFKNAARTPDTRSALLVINLGHYRVCILQSETQEMYSFPRPFPLYAKSIPTSGLRNTPVLSLCWEDHGPLFVLRRPGGMFRGVGRDRALLGSASSLLAKSHSLSLPSGRDGNRQVGGALSGHTEAGGGEGPPAATVCTGTGLSSPPWAMT